MYWDAPRPSHATWDGMPAIFAEDKNLMTVRNEAGAAPGRLVAAAALGHEPRGRQRRRRARNRRTATWWRARAST